jgi:HAD superfamily hydrolase (TIGR01509 family)
MPHPPERSLIALILDMDGVLADTEPLHVRSWDITLGEIDSGAPAHERGQLAGMSSTDIARELVRMLRLPLGVEELVERKRGVFRNLISSGLAPFDGLVEELRAWRSGPLALATSSARRETEIMLSGLGFDGWFNPIVTSDDVTRAKPAPDVYDLAIRRLGVRPEECVVIEDTLHGIQAARDAGAAVVGVASSGLPRHIDGVLGVFDSTVEALRWLRRS